jgi:hypothetical protein
MTNQDRQSTTPLKREPVVYPRRRGSLTSAHRGGRWGDGRYLAAYRRLLFRHQRLIRHIGIGSSVLAGVLLLAFLGLWWRLASGPIQLDAFTPWLVSAIEENFGSRERIEVGGTQIERTENGGAAVRIRDIVVRDPDGTVVASAPKAEVHVSGMSLLGGQLRAESLNLVGAEMAVRIERNGEVTVFAGANRRPIATASVPAAALGQRRPGTGSPAGVTPPTATAPDTRPAADAAPQHPATDALAAILTWIDGIGETGLDGHDLRELGLKNGNLTVVDERTGKKWSFHDISLSLERPRGGGVVVTVGSDNPDHRWGFTASITPGQNGYRNIEIEARQVSANDLLLALRLGDGSLQTDVPLSASLRGEIGPDGVPRSLTGRIVAGAGSIGDANEGDGRLDLERAEFKLNWDASNHVLAVPFQIVSGGNRITLLGQIQAPEQAGGQWSFRIGGGTVMLTSAGKNTDPLILNRIAISGRFDPAKKLFVIDGGDFGNNGVGVALSGSADYSDGAFRLNAGFAGQRMSVDTLKRLWPAFISPKLRAWLDEHLISGTVEHLVVAVNAPVETLKASGPPIPDNGLSIEAIVTGCVVQPVAGLPALKDADLTVHIVGRDAQVVVNRANADLPSGRKMVLTSGLFEVPDTDPQDPPARVRFKLDGPVAGAAELLSLDRLRDVSGTPFDPATVRGTMTAQVYLTMPLKADLPPGSTDYSIAVDATNFSADHMIMGQRVEATALHVAATPAGFQLKGDVRIGGTPATLEYHKARGDSQADIRIEGVLDAAARSNLGLDTSATISGSIPVRLVGRVAGNSDREGRFTIEADLTSAQINGFLPGWVKLAGKPSRATFTLTTRPDSTRIEDLVIEGVGQGVKGVIELDGSGELVSANFPSYGFSDGDRATLRVERAPDGALRVTLRGDVYDARGFIRTATAGTTEAQPDTKRATPDIDFDLRVGAVLGFNGEALRNLDLKMSRRAGVIRSFGLNARLGHDATLLGELRSRPDGRQVVYLRTNDAATLFRITDVYTRMNGGQLAMIMDAPSVATPAQQGTLIVHDFAVHDETQLQRAASNGPEPVNGDLQFSSLRVDFTKLPGRIALHDGVVRGPVLGGTIDGLIDYARDDVHLRGTLVPLYGANNLLGQIPVVGLFLGGQKEGLVGVTYEVVGRPGKPVLNVNLFSALAPGLLRRIFEFPAATDPLVEDTPR